MRRQPPVVSPHRGPSSRWGVVIWLVAALAPAVTRADVDTVVLAAEQRRVEAIARGSAAAVAVFAGAAGGGSGVLVSADGYALTNFHVVQSAGPALTCGLSDGRLYDAVLVGLDPTGDVALVKLLGRDDFPHAAFADSELVRPGDFCFAAGNPFLLATDLQPSISVGIVSGVHRYQFPAGTILEYTDCLQVDAAINPGNSGGGLFDAEGRIIGLNGRASFEKRGRVNVGVGYAISTTQLRHFLGCLRAGRLVDHASLGATVASDAEGRPVVSDILESSDAWRRGLRYDDEIVALAGRPVRTVNALKNVLGTLPAGWQVPLVYRRGGRRVETLVRLAGVHTPAELAAIVSGERRRAAAPRPDGRPPGPAAEPERAVPDAVRAVYEPRAGFVNHHFNIVERDRVARAVAAGVLARQPGPWEMAGTLAAGGRFRIRLADDEAVIDMPGGTSRLETGGDLDDGAEPAGSGGLLAALVVWRRLVREGPAGLGGTSYWGTAPRVPEALGPATVGDLVDVLETAVGGVTARLAVQEDGRVVGVDLWTAADAEPCEVRFDLAEADPRGLPHTIRVARGGEPFATFHMAAEPPPAPGARP